MVSLKLSLFVVALVLCLGADFAYPQPSILPIVDATQCQIICMESLKFGSKQSGYELCNRYIPRFCPAGRVIRRAEDTAGRIKKWANRPTRYPQNTAYPPHPTLYPPYPTEHPPYPPY